MEIDRETFLANARLMEKREAERASPQEDLGYQGRPVNTFRNPFQSLQTNNGQNRPQSSDSLSRAASKLSKKRVTYLRGTSAGLTHWLREDIADDLIRRGWAREIKNITDEMEEK